MDKILVHGGHKLSGTVRISGSKNSALPILAATLLTKEPCTISNVPDLSDIHFMLQILSQLGASVERASGTVRVEAQKIKSEAPYDIVRKMRASVCVLGPLLGRKKKAVVSLPGGCVIGDRPIDLHIRGFEALGATSVIEHGNVKLSARTLRGTEMNLSGKNGPTVLGTDNVMMAAVLAKGVTVIEGAAAEPEVVDLANFLKKMGAKIEGAGTRRITIEGVKELHGAEHSVIPDRIEAGTYLVAGAMMGTEVRLQRVNPAHLTSVIEFVRESGYEVETAAHSLTVRGNGNPKPLRITTEPYPGFPTDMQAQYMALATQAEGVSLVRENIFENRFMHVQELVRMGANIKVDGRTATVRGPARLSAAAVMCSDLRASASLVLAALVADGESILDRVYHMDRGYERIEQKLQGVGAQIRRMGNIFPSKGEDSQAD
jgi:UDP-N-acetylglucosamine 1-carboxyvinyltransferase